jgi:hypothetical protein
MVYTYNLGTAVGQMRLLIPDRGAPGQFDIWSADGKLIFTDEELQAFLDQEGNVVKAGCALALEVIGSDEALVLKVMRQLDFETDGAKLSDALLARAVKLREQAAIGTTDDPGDDFDWSHFPTKGYYIREDGVLVWP